MLFLMSTKGPTYKREGRHWIIESMSLTGRKTCYVYTTKQICVTLLTLRQLIHRIHSIRSQTLKQRKKKKHVAILNLKGCYTYAQAHTFTWQHKHTHKCAHIHLFLPNTHKHILLFHFYWTAWYIVQVFCLFCICQSSWTTKVTQDVTSVQGGVSSQWSRWRKVKRGLIRTRKNCFDL